MLWDLLYATNAAPPAAVRRIQGHTNVCALFDANVNPTIYDQLHLHLSDVIMQRCLDDYVT